MENSEVLVRFPTHTAKIRVQASRITVFKYTGRSCDFDSFSDQEQWDASDYIVEPPPDIHYQVIFPGEE